MLVQLDAMSLIGCAFNLNIEFVPCKTLLQRLRKKNWLLQEQKGDCAILYALAHSYLLNRNCVCVCVRWAPLVFCNLHKFRQPLSWHWSHLLPFYSPLALQNGCPLKSMPLYYDFYCLVVAPDIKSLIKDILRVRIFITWIFNLFCVRVHLCSLLFAAAENSECFC